MSLYRTPLHAEHIAAGARMVAFAGWEMPLQYSGILDEHAATRHAAGLFDTSHMGELRVSGTNSTSVLRRVLTRPMDDLAPGRARYALICAADGGVIDDCIAFRFGEHDYWIVVNAGTKEDDLAWLVSHAEGDCAVTDESAAVGKIDVQGPAAEAVVARVCRPADAVRALRFFAFMDAKIADTSVRISRSGYTGEDGFEVFCEASATPSVWRALLEAGGDPAARPCGLGARDLLRLEACLPLYGHELSRDRAAHCAGMDWAIDLQSPFIGRDALHGEPDECLVPFRLGGRQAAREGVPIYEDAESTRKVGVVTSGAYCPALQTAAGMAYVQQPCSRPGSAVCVEIRGRRTPAEIVEKPLYKRPGNA